ncbi:hypothetical protein N7540_003263 [Penicillium herquei]|nr:hypothetical protein N7540_003263 [Penicillium herquei]
MAEDLNISNRISTAFLGSVRIQQLDQLIFDDIDTLGSRAYDPAKTDHLLHRFDHEGCRRLDPLTWIAGLMPKDDFENFSVGDNTMVLPNDRKVLCLQGQHRIAAALLWLLPYDTWWNINVYDPQQLDENCLRRLRECSHSRSHTFSDGEIFRDIRHYQRQGNTSAANEWFARWSTTKCREFKRIYEPRKNQNQFSALAESLDALLQFPPLWTSWHMENHLPSLNCPEELTEALAEVFSAWHSITSGQHFLLDTNTLEMLEGRCPSLSLADRRYIIDIFQNRLAFPMARDATVRSKTLYSVLGYSKIIPSRKVFLENVKYLKPMTDVVKKLLPRSSKDTMRRALRRYFVVSDEQFGVQCPEDGFTL